MQTTSIIKFKGLYKIDFIHIIEKYRLLFYISIKNAIVAFYFLK